MALLSTELNVSVTEEKLMVAIRESMAKIDDTLAVHTVLFLEEIKSIKEQRVTTKYILELLEARQKELLRLVYPFAVDVLKYEDKLKNIHKPTPLLFDALRTFRSIVDTYQNDINNAIVGVMDIPVVSTLSFIYKTKPLTIFLLGVSIIGSIYLLI